VTCSHFRRALGVAGVLLLLPAPSHAHLVNTGLGPFYDGVSHFALTPEDLLPALALALLAGQRGSRAGRLALFALPAAWLVGRLVGLAFPTITYAPVLTTVSFLALGGLVATEARLRPEWVAALAAAMVVAIRVPWGRIAVRVAGSWIVAIGLLLLGWSLRGA
jgi:urease accessory protein